VKLNLIDQIFPFIFAKNNNGEFDEKLAIMIIDGTLPLGNNPLATSQEFNKRGITLVVVAYVTPIFRIWDFYDTLARDTGINRFLIHFLLTIYVKFFFCNFRWCIYVIAKCFGYS
jgi:hypothetical protein